MTTWRMSFRAGSQGHEMWPDCFRLGVAAITYYPLERTDLSKYREGEPQKLWAQLKPTQKASLRRVAYEMKARDVIYVKQGPKIVSKGKRKPVATPQADLQQLKDASPLWPCSERLASSSILRRQVTIRPRAALHPLHPRHRRHARLRVRLSPCRLTRYLASTTRTRLQRISHTKGKLVVVSGTVVSLGKDFLSTPYVVLGGSGFLDGVQCVFPRSDTSLARVSKGDSISVRGRVSSKMGNVVVRDCTLE